jgi:hypothetical protein
MVFGPNRRVARRTARRVARRQSMFQESAPPPEAPPPAPAQPAAPVAGAGSVDPTEELRNLAELHKQGILTDEEFAAKKKQILGI